MKTDYQTKNNFFLLYANCIPVKGIIRATICDLQRNKYELIPLGLYEILIDTYKISVADIFIKYSFVDVNIIIEYFDWLINNEYGFYTTTPECFPKLKLIYKNNSIINNSIVDIDNNSKHNYLSIFKQLDSLGTKFIELRSYDFINFSKASKILSAAKGLRFRNIDFFIKSNLNFSIERFRELFNENPALGRLVFHSANENRRIEIDKSKLLCSITKKIHSEDCCGIISPEYFSINIETFTESQHFNTCLNRKISIDKNGLIKNCPSLKKSYGNISDTKLNDVILNDSFNSIWKASKSKISVCKFCEFRHICTDCRAYQINESILNKPIKCKYNPHIAKWED